MYQVYHLYQEVNYIVFENHQKYRISIFQFWHFPPIFAGNTVLPQTSGLQKLAKMDHFWLFLNEFLSS